MRAEGGHRHPGAVADRLGSGSRQELEALPGIGPRTAGWLLSAGINSREEIASLGAVEAYRRLAEREPGVSLNALWVLDGIVTGCDWREVSPSRKGELLALLRVGGGG
jgi:DNA transformation protein and related proteins